MPFRAASLDADADRLKDILDASGITVNPYFGSCTSIEFTGWDPDRGDIDVFVFQTGTSSCPGDSLGRFYAIRNSAVVVEAAACGDCEPGIGPDAERYVAIRRALEGKPAIHGIVGGGARWGFDGFEEIVLGSPGTTSPATGPRDRLGGSRIRLRHCELGRRVGADRRGCVLLAERQHRLHPLERRRHLRHHRARLDAPRQGLR